MTERSTDLWQISDSDPLAFESHGDLTEADADADGLIAADLDAVDVDHTQVGDFREAR